MSDARALARWRRAPLVSLAEDVLANAALLREANVLSHCIGAHVSFQYAIARPHPHGIAESATQGVLAGASDIRSSELPTRLPAVCVRVIDHIHCCVTYWTIGHLATEINHLRRLWTVRRASVNQPPPRLVSEAVSPYAHVASASVPLFVLAEQASGDWKLPFRSMFNGNVVGTCNVALSATRGDVYVTVDSVELRDPSAFHVAHLQIAHATFGGADERVSVSRQVPMDDAYAALEMEAVMHTSSAKWHGVGVVSLFARPMPAFLASIELEDVQREQGGPYDLAYVSGIPPPASLGRVHEREHRGEQTHGVHASVSLVEDGSARPLLHARPPYFPLRRGTRHFVIALHHESATELVLTRPASVSLSVRLVDARGHTITGAPLPLPLSIERVQRAAAHTGTRTLQFDAVWGLDANSEELLARATPVACRVALGVNVSVGVLGCDELISMSVPLNVCICGQRGIFARPLPCTSVDAFYVVRIIPRRCRSAAELWRIDTRRTAVHGQEVLGNWVPRGLRLIAELLKSEQLERDIVSVYRIRNHMEKDSHARGMEDAYGHIARSVLAEWPPCHPLDEVRAF